MAFHSRHHRPRAEHHNRKRKRRLFAGPLQKSYMAQMRLERLNKLGKKPRKRREVAGKLNASYMHELRMMRAEELGKGSVRTRHDYANRLKQFGGQNKNPRVP